MLWFLFLIGFIIAILGIFISASDIDLEIKDYSFDNDILGAGLTAIGGVLAIVMLFALGINWLVTA